MKKSDKIFRLDINIEANLYKATNNRETYFKNIEKDLHKRLEKKFIS